MHAASAKWQRRMLGALTVLGAGALLLEIYARYPSSAEATPLDLRADTTEVVLLFHGSDGRDEPMLIEIARRLSAQRAGDAGRIVRHYVWSPPSDERLRASVHGPAIGRALGRELAGIGQLKKLSLIAHSAGAYLPDALCEEYRSDADSPARIEMTFLDPIGIAGGWDYSYGYRNFGRCADFASAYINLDDFAPGTNAPLREAYNHDVTDAAARGAFDGRGHLWPVRYYLDAIVAGGDGSAERTHAEFPRGEVQRIE